MHKRHFLPLFRLIYWRNQYREPIDSREIRNIFNGIIIAKYSWQNRGIS